MKSSQPFIRPAEAEANARLIAIAPELLTALISLSNEVFGSMPLAESAIRQEIGNTNYNCLMRRAEEARALIASLNEARTDAKLDALRAAVG